MKSVCVRNFQFPFSSFFSPPFAHLKADSDTSESMSVKIESNPLHSTDAVNSKIDKRLKRRRKFMIGDLSCMKAVFVPAPRVANADIKYIR